MDCTLSYKKGNVNKSELVKFYKDLEKKCVTVGIHKDKGQQIISKNGFTQGQNAYVQEFGSNDGRIPARPFVRVFLIDIKCKQQLEKILQETIDEKIKRLNMIAVSSTWERVGAYASAIMADRIYMGIIKPDNKPSTVKKKGKNHPLFDTGRLARDINYKVRGK